jgi:hypothetical protein
MTAPTARLGRELEDVERRMDAHQAAAERLADAGHHQEAAVAYGRALQLAIALRHVWIGLGGEGRPEAERFRRRRRRYAELEARHRDWPWASGGPPPGGLERVRAWCGALFPPHGGPAGANSCSPGCLTAAEDHVGIGDRAPDREAGR